jgi:D-sedoheptulose 7-phosphate isomerase
MNSQRILEHFRESAELNIQAQALLCEPVSQAVTMMFTALSNGNRILACGNGGSAADCQRFASKLIGRFERERLPLPAMALTTDSSTLSGVGNDFGFQSSSGNASNVVEAAQAALEREMHIIALTGGDGGVLAQLLTDTDVHICVPHDRVARIQEMHLLVIHCLCDGIDVALFGGDLE